MNVLRPALAAAALLVVAAGCDLSSRTPGERLWRARCAECHGLDATGNTPRFMGQEWADLTDDSWHEYGGDESSLETVIRQGIFGQMPANPDLTPAEMRDLLDHLRKLRGEAAK